MLVGNILSPFFPVVWNGHTFLSSHRHFSRNDTELLSVPETDLLEDLVWAGKTFATSPLGKIKVRELRSPVSSFFSLNSPLVDCTETWDTAYTYRYYTGREMVTSQPELFGRTDRVHKNLSLHFAVLCGRTVDAAKGWRKEGHRGRFNMENIFEHLECVIINYTSLVSTWLKVLY